MHQSPQKKLGSRRDKYVAVDPDDRDDLRRWQRSAHPKARRFQLRDEAPREERASRQHPRG